MDISPFCSTLDALLCPNNQNIANVSYECFSSMTEEGMIVIEAAQWVYSFNVYVYRSQFFLRVSFSSLNLPLLTQHIFINY